MDAKTEILWNTAVESINRIKILIEFETRQSFIDVSILYYIQLCHFIRICENPPVFKYINWLLHRAARISYEHIGNYKSLRLIIIKTIDY